METELKFSLAPRAAPLLARHPRLAGIRARQRRLLSIYYDTPEWALRDRRVALRLRRSGYHWIQAVKGESLPEGALSRRPEWEVAVAGGRPDLAVLPEAALAWLEDIDPGRLHPVFQTDIRRVTWEVAQGASRVELALDRGEIRSGEARLPVCEVELELLSGEAADLLVLANELLDRVPLGIDTRSKAERGFLLAGAGAAPLGAIRPALHASQTAGAAWEAVLAAALAQLVANVPGFLEHPEELEYLHQLRIALRRLRGAAGLAAGLGLARPDWAKDLARMLRGLNAARDWDVLLQETLPAVESVLAEAPLSADFQAALRQAGTEARRAAQDLVASPDFTRLVLALGAGLGRAGKPGPTAGEWAASILEKRWKAFRRLGPRTPDPNAAELHAMRIAAKKLRYAADALEGLYGRRSKVFLRRLAAFQDVLGRFNDSHVAMGLLAETAVGRIDLAFDAGRACGVLAAGLAGHAPHSKGALREILRAKPYWIR